MTKAPRSSTSTVARGNAFRDHIATLLRTEHDDVATEQYIDGTAVDITFSEIRYGKRHRYAAECKNYGGPLKKNDIAKDIAPVYEPLLRAGKIDQVMIVGQFPLGVDAQSWIDANPRFVHVTEQQLIEMLLGLGDYVGAMAVQPAVREGAYIEARFDGHTGPAIDLVHQWIDDGSGAGAGLAVLAGYGRGKSSFANRLARDQAERYRNNRSARLPVLIRLGQEIHEISLEALFGKEFTARSRVKSYSFNKIELLNREGRLLVILDGFDEMKHAMTHTDFLTNFRQINRLLVGKAKVLLLGRPSAFSSETHELVLRGRETVNGQKVVNAKFLAWKEYTLARFDESETRALLSACLASAVELIRAHGSESPTEGFVERRTAEIMGLLKETDLLDRPVHIALIADLGANPGFRFEGFNEYQLYKRFVDKAIEREVVDKPARKAIQKEARWKFMWQLAWWAWTRSEKSQVYFERESIPASVLVELPDGNAQDQTSLLGEYLVSALTESKEDGTLYFGHRSYQEFLIAERMIATPITPVLHSEYARHANTEIFKFLKQGLPETMRAEWCHTLDLCPGQLTASYVMEFADWHPSRAEPYVLAQTAFHEANLAMTIAMIATRRAPLSDAVQRWLGDVIVQGSPLNSALAVLALCIHGTTQAESMIVRRLIAALLARCLQRAQQSHTKGETLVIAGDQPDLPLEVVRKGIELSGSRREKLILDLGDLRDRTLAWLAAQTSFLLHPDSWTVAVMDRTFSRVELNRSDAYDILPEKTRTAHNGFLFPRSASRYSISTVVTPRRRELS